MPLLTNVPKIKFKPVREVVYEYLRDAIVGGHLMPGTQFTDSQIAGEFHVSRTPVREAVQKLEAEGLIKRTPMKGNVVTGLSPLELVQIFAIRKALESEAVQYAAFLRTHQDLEAMRSALDEAQQVFRTLPEEQCQEAYIPLAARFNRALFDAAHSSRLTDLIWIHRELLDRYRLLRAVASRRPIESLQIREQLYSLIEAQDSEAAGALWARHIDGSYRIWTKFAHIPEGAARYLAEPPA